MYVETTKYKQEILGYTNKQKAINKHKKYNKEMERLENEDNNTIGESDEWERFYRQRD